MARGRSFGVEVVAVEQRARRGERERAAGADADQPVLGLEHVARAGQHQRTSASATASIASSRRR